MKQKVTFNARQITEILTRHTLENTRELALNITATTAVTETRWDIHPDAHDNSITLVLEDGGK